ncbi:unnamed protein product [Nesidiocoris tenuis]|uniref:Uncharacterized protein n=1 Tax=Nesidiocoris tenuis TaxID=355587 RepID=A0A6H5GY36_9HEMI|nr:unnamed protein product [Nesidiocoris tenuis]
MSASPIARQATQCQAIPSKRVIITDPSQLPSNYSSTPGGTLFSTTPGGTRIVYERATLMHLRNSPLSQTPPKISDYYGIGKGSSPDSRKSFSKESSNKKSPQKSSKNTFKKSGTASICNM